MPNQKFIDSPVTNWTYGDPKVRFRLPVGVAYGSDVEKVQAKLIEAAAEDPHTLEDPAPSVFFVEFGNSSLNFELVAWSNEMSHRPRRYRSDLNFAIDRKFREAGNRDPIPATRSQYSQRRFEGEVSIEAVRKGPFRNRFLA